MHFAGEPSQLSIESPQLGIEVFDAPVRERLLRKRPDELLELVLEHAQILRQHGHVQYGAIVQVEAEAHELALARLHKNSIRRDVLGKQRLALEHRAQHGSSLLQERLAALPRPRARGAHEHRVSTLPAPYRHADQEAALGGVGRRAGVSCEHPRGQLADPSRRPGVTGVPDALRLLSRCTGPERHAPDRRERHKRREQDVHRKIRASGEQLRRPQDLAREGDSGVARRLLQPAGQPPRLLRAEVDLGGQRTKQLGGGDQKTRLRRVLFIARSLQHLQGASARSSACSLECAALRPPALGE